MTDIPPQIFNSFVAIMLVGAVFALTLSVLATKKGQVQADMKEKTDDKFSTSVFREINRLPLSTHQQMQTVETIVGLFDKQLHKKLSGVSQELTAKYEKMIEEKDKTVKILEHDYKTVSQKYEEVDKNYRKLGTEKRKTEAIVHAMADGLIVVNKNGEVLLLNPAAEKLLGVKKEDRVGKSILSEVKDEQLVSFAKDISGSEEKEIIIQSPSEQTKMVLRTNNAVIESEEGETMGFVSVLSDVTKQRELDQMKSNFVANVSHELRTPLFTIQETISLLIDQTAGQSTPQQAKILTLAKKECERLARLINDLLDVHKIEAKQFQIKPSLFVLNDLVEHTIAGFQAWANSKKMTLEIKLPSHPIQVEADPDRISQVLTNLMGNALKYTPAGGKITVEVKTIKKPDSNNSEWLRVDVQDTGPGIPQKDKNRIFERFTQLGSAPATGTGLGLAIVKEMIEFHHGRVWVESENGAGSRFIFEIPLKFQP